MKAEPVTKASEIAEKVNEFARNGGPFARKDSLWWRALKREAEQVRDVEPGLGWATLGTLMAIAGDYEELVRCYTAAMPFSGAFPEIATNYMVNLSNLGYHSAVLALGAEVARPERGFFSTRGNLLVKSGGFVMAAQFLERAREMGLDVSNLSGPEIELAAFLLREAELSDWDVAKHLDLAGEMLRKRGHLFVKRPVVDVQDVEGVFTGITYTMMVRLPRSDVFEMNCALAQAEVEAGIKRHPYFDVTFSATE
ncbi:hypothetical protein K7G19_19675 [Cupriavidus sp. DB3]|uniref:hypothetical protein n=1 Tax=Cupriavidus sp. DB3 TaxID=2873259 RepID=UPI001CF5A628|nr:hypothetical protein [Cupriavidus sp. DB3]MCA7085812.1 hypothetical protein [Cupriavidus sp. DB3]